MAFIVNDKQIKNQALFVELEERTREKLFRYLHASVYLTLSVNRPPDDPPTPPSDNQSLKDKSE